MLDGYEGQNGVIGRAVYQVQGPRFNVKTPLIQPVLTRLSRAVDMC